MALTEIEYGSLASSNILNNNFEYLDNKISGVSEDLQARDASMNSNIVTINSSLATMSGTLTEAIDGLKNKFSFASESGLYITTYVNESSWYREYFSDEAKTERVWLEQGFITPIVYWGDNDQKAYNLVKPFSNNLYTAIVTSTGMFTGNGVASGNVAVENTSTTQVFIGNDAHNTFGVRVYACGI